MPFKIKQYHDDFLDSLLVNAKKELENFFAFKYEDKRMPSLFIVDTRQEINAIRNEKTPNWLIGWVNGGNIFVLSPKNYNKESSHHYSKDEYIALVKHEFCHLFFVKLVKSSYPMWLNEGLALFLEGKNNRKKIIEFKSFLKFTKKHTIGKSTVYDESGFAVELLVNKHGKEKLLKLISSPLNFKNQKYFNLAFKKIYGFAPTYTKFNDMLNHQR